MPEVPEVPEVRQGAEGASGHGASGALAGLPQKSALAQVLRTVHAATTETVDVRGEKRVAQSSQPMTRAPSRAQRSVGGVAQRDKHTPDEGSRQRLQPYLLAANPRGGPDRGVDAIIASVLELRPGKRAAERSALAADAQQSAPRHVSQSVG